MTVKPGITEGAETTDKAACGRIAWLGAEWREGKADQAERPAVRRESGGSENLHSTDPVWLESGERSG